jgi:hypothetical protein
LKKNPSWISFYIQLKVHLLSYKSQNCFKKRKKDEASLWALHFILKLNARKGVTQRTNRKVCNNSSNIRIDLRRIRITWTKMFWHELEWSLDLLHSFKLSPSLSLSFSPSSDFRKTFNSPRLNKVSLYVFKGKKQRKNSPSKQTEDETADFRLGKQNGA